MAKDIVGENIAADKGAFTFTVSKVEEVMEVPFVYGPNIITRVADTVHKYKRGNKVNICALKVIT